MLPSLLEGNCHFVAIIQPSLLIFVITSMWYTVMLTFLSSLPLNVVSHYETVYQKGWGIAYAIERTLPMWSLPTHRSLQHISPRDWEQEIYTPTHEEGWCQRRGHSPKELLMLGRRHKNQLFCSTMQVQGMEFCSGIRWNFHKDLKTLGKY